MSLAGKMTEAEFTRQVLDLLKLRGWMTMHIRPARTKHGWRTAVAGDGKGFPDILAVRKRDGRCICLELKMDGRKPTPEQVAWLDALRAAGVEAGVVRPGDWEAIEKLLE